MTEFTPVSALIGGALLGFASVLLMKLNGRIAGISGILNGAISIVSGDRLWRWLFIAGLILGGVLHQAVTQQPLITRESFPIIQLIIAGVLVGFGTRLGSGLYERPWSLWHRQVVSPLHCFYQHLSSDWCNSSNCNLYIDWGLNMIIRRAFSGLITGTLFGIGLAVSQMTNPEKVLSFLTLKTDWDPSLLLVMGAAVIVTWLGYRWVLNGQPLFDSKYSLPTNRAIDVRLLAGAIVFGIGWGVAGYCPGPALAGLGSGSAEPLIFILSMIAGSQIAKLTSR